VLVRGGLTSTLRVARVIVGCILPGMESRDASRAQPIRTDRDSIHRRAIRIAAAALVAGLGLSSAGLAPEVADVVIITQPVSEDLYLAGESVEVRADVDGDLTVAGQRVTVNGRITGDVMAAGENVTVAGVLLDDARLAGRSVTLTGHVGDHVVAAGESVVLAEPARVGGFAWLAGNRVDVQGTVDGELAAAGQAVTLSGAVVGNVELDSPNAVIADGAHIQGDLTWPRGHAPEIHAGARIDGRRIETEGHDDAGVSMMKGPGIVLGIILGTLSLWLLTLVLRISVPPVMQGAAALLRSRPGLSLGVGLLALIVAPILAVIAFITVIGAPLGVVVLLAYLTLLLIGVPVALDLVTDLGLGRARKGRPVTRGWRVLALALVSLVFVGVAQIPILGAIVAFAAVVLGMGALVLRAVRRSAEGPAVGPTIATHGTTE
jgi:cytoskeletal protein CcmA (bactofilin family)